LKNAFNEIAEQRALPPEIVLEALQSALVSAYRRDSGISSAQMIEARIDPETGRARIFVEKEVSESVISPKTEVTLEDARFYDPEAQIGDMVMVQVEHSIKKFGRIAAQTAKQVILQKVREAERNALYEEFVNREGDLMTGTVQNISAKGVTLSIGRAEVFLSRKEQIPGERYSQHQKLRVLIVEVRKTNKGPQINCSRSHRNMLRRLLEYEVPEIYNGQVEIKSIAREAGYRSKVAVAALQDGIDPVGACVGMRGIRIQNIVKELQDEKIDVIEWNDDPEVFISKALSPARVTGVYLEDEDSQARTAVVVVPDDQLSLAIGREGQNARLAAKLTGWRIDIKSVSETVAEALENIEQEPLSELILSHPAMVADAQAIIAKKAENRTIMPEEFTLLNKFADLVERRWLHQREQIREMERAHIEAVKSTLPPALFKLPMSTLPLSEDIQDALKSLDSVGDAVLATLVDEGQLESLLNRQGMDAMSQLRSALDTLMASDIDFEALAETYQQEMADEESVSEIADPSDPSDTVDEEISEERARSVIDEVNALAKAQQASDGAQAEVLDDIAEEVFEQETEDSLQDIVTTPANDKIEVGANLDDMLQETDDIAITEADVDETDETSVDYDDYMVQYNQFDKFDEIDVSQIQDAEAKPKKKRRRRRLVIDESTGEVVAKRHHKKENTSDEQED
jgi:N utilization substance protein A